MDLKLVWLETAEKNLNEIFQYYKINASLNTARNLISMIIDSAEILIEHPLAGPLEELLKKRKRKYRYFVAGNYKLIYSQDKKYIYVHLVFDTRQNPKKLRKVK